MAGPDVGPLALEWAGTYPAEAWQRYIDRFADEGSARRFREVVDGSVGRRQSPQVLSCAHAGALLAARNGRRANR